MSFQMRIQTRGRPLLRTTQLLLLVMLVIAAYGGAAGAGDTDSGSRFDKLGHRIMCPCGCNELLAECNHVGCPDSDSMRNQLMASIQRGGRQQHHLSCIRGAVRSAGTGRTHVHRF